MLLVCTNPERHLVGALGLLSPGHSQRKPEALTTFTLPRGMHAELLVSLPSLHRAYTCPQGMKRLDSASHGAVSGCHAEK